jgi:twitching motility two-component system response regulator PilH
MAGRKILVVEDSPTQLKLTVEALGGQGYEILTAMDGKEALEKVLNDKPELVLLDVVMPVMDGFQVCRKMKVSPDMRHIPVIMLTSKNQKADEFWGKKQGADLYLTKPFDKLQLQHAVVKILA